VDSEQEQTDSTQELYDDRGIHGLPSVGRFRAPVVFFTCLSFSVRRQFIYQSLFAGSLFITPID